MHALKAYQWLFILLIVALAVTCLISPWAALAADWFMGPADRYPFSRIFNRTYMVVAIFLFLLFRRSLRIGSLNQLGLAAPRRGMRDLITGWLLALGSMIALGAAMSIAGAFRPYFRLSLSESLADCAGALASALTVGLLEEIFFRGIFLKGLMEDLKAFWAFLWANLFYAALHFVKPGEPYMMDVFDPWLGFRHLASTFAPFFDPSETAPGFIGLFMIGIALSYAFLRTGSVYLSIGLHAGWVFSIKTIRVFGNYRREDLGWMFGSTDPKIVSGLVTWAGILIVIGVVHWMTRRQAHRWAAAEAGSDGSVRSVQSV